MEHQDASWGESTKQILRGRVYLAYEEFAHVAGGCRASTYLLFAQGDYRLPLATTEAAMVASLSRGSQMITEAGECRAIVLDEGIGRAPTFAFHTLAACGGGDLEHWEVLYGEAESTTGSRRLRQLRAIMSTCI
jgi:hydroxymethylglutaryl-CoA reductase